MIVRAIVTKLKTDDGLVEFEPSVALGQQYLVVLDSVQRNRCLLHVPESGGPPIEHQKDLVWTPDGLWLPLECLRLEA